MLFHLLLACKKHFNFELHVAHIDHNWRPESGEEAKILSKIMEEYATPFHLLTLKTGEAASEEKARQARLNFFSDLSRQEDYQAVILGHHADDQAETILKRILEGASLTALEGIRPIQLQGDLQVWRPFLTIPKKKIVQWASHNQLVYFNDPTNWDPKYLRSKMRTLILPQLEEAFGKKVSSNLIRLGELAIQMKGYVSQKSAFFSMELLRDEEQMVLDFNPYYPLHPLELKVFLKHFFHDQNILVSYRNLDLIQFFLENKTNYKKIDSLIINNGRLLIQKKQKI